MPPEERFVPRFAAEPPQEEAPHGRWEARLREELLAGLPALTQGAVELGEPGEVLWYPDRSWHGRTYVPATCPTAGGYELFGYVRFLSAVEGREPSDFSAHLDFTDETAERNPDWQLDLCDEVIGSWRGHAGATAAMTLVWGHPLISGGRTVAAGRAGGRAWPRPPPGRTRRRARPPRGPLRPSGSSPQAACHRSPCSWRACPARSWRPGWSWSGCSSSICRHRSPRAPHRRRALR